MNIAIFVYDISKIGGAERVAINLANEFSELYDAYLISLFNSNHFINNDKKWKLKVLSKTTSSITSNFIKYSMYLRRYLKTNKIDVLIAITAGVVTLSIAASSAIKTCVIYAEHSNLENRTYGKKHQFRQFIGAKMADVVVTLTDRDRINFMKKYRLKGDKVYVIPNWYEKNISSVEYNLSSKRIISVGRLEKVKGYDLLLEIAQEVYKYAPDWHWDIYGEGSLYQEIQMEIENKKLNNFITLQGNRSDINEIYSRYAFLVMTSLFEGLPMVLLEAQSASLPIVCFDCPTGPSEIIKNNVNGYLVEAYSLEEMVQRIVYLINHTECRKRFANKADIGLERFSKKNVLKLWIDLFQKYV